MENLDHSSTPSVSTPVSQKACRILVVDDDPDNRHYVCRVLEQHWVVESTNHGLKALDLAKDNPPDLIIADVVMPAINGFEFVQELHADSRTKAIRVILLSGRDDEDAQEKAKEVGANDYLIKPVDSHELVTRVRSLLENRKS
jgi:PleD family two-component response regulator